MDKIIIPNRSTFNDLPILMWSFEGVYRPKQNEVKSTGMNLQKHQYPGMQQQTICSIYEKVSHFHGTLPGKLPHKNLLSWKKVFILQQQKETSMLQVHSIT